MAKREEPSKPAKAWSPTKAKAINRAYGRPAERKLPANQMPAPETAPREPKP